MKTQKSKRLLIAVSGGFDVRYHPCRVWDDCLCRRKTDEVCLISFPRDGDANYDGEWAHNSFNL